MFDLFRIICTGEIDKMRRVFGNRVVVTEFLQHRQVMIKPDKFYVAVFNFPRPELDIHYKKHYAAYDQCDVTTMREFLHQRNEVCYFNCDIGDKKNVYPQRFYPV